MMRRSTQTKIFTLLHQTNKSLKVIASKMCGAHLLNKCCEHDLQPIWVNENKCKKMKTLKNDVFIMEDFEGTNSWTKVFSTLFEEPIPEGTSPEEKELVERLVEYMGGILTKQLRSSVAHLVTGSVMSAKYQATERKIPIVTKEWIKAIWEENLKLPSSSI